MEAFKKTVEKGRTRFFTLICKILSINLNINNKIFLFSI